MKKYIYYMFLSLAVIALCWETLKIAETSQPAGIADEKGPAEVGTAMVEYRLPVMVARSYRRLLLLRLYQGVGNIQGRQ
ncbi:hypothetical protein [Chitinophaga agri]|uniref:Uncharacterized protein n=1 Tax=Chitinophaga agri TaxID=2703787 RepID=A0A6B9ZDF1_9BACT|nr:hypothetical protein [Chitinophaga agri]QHS58533.1 hypothetical protein GWR21_02650 [Chitinophaga agri]